MSITELVPVSEVPLDTVCEVLTVYVPVPPVPVPSAVIVVPAVTPVPARISPTASVPEVTLETVSVVVEMDPVKEAVMGAGRVKMWAVAPSASLVTVCEELTV